MIGSWKNLNSFHAALLALLALSDQINSSFAFQLAQQQSFGSGIRYQQKTLAFFQNNKQNHQDRNRKQRLSFHQLHAVSAPPRRMVIDEDSTAVPFNTEDDNDVTFPPPLTPFQRFQRAAKFWSSAFPIVARYYTLQNQISLHSLFSSQPLDDAAIEDLWNQAHLQGADELATTITDLKGFYVKTAQIISSRQDLFPKAYTDSLAGFTDTLDPMPASLARAVVQNELLHANEQFDDIFSEFDDEPLGAASVAQVHRARLRSNNREVAVKIQRPGIESKLLGDVANLKALAKTFRDNPNLPVDYYTVFCELETQLADEFDFVAEAVAMDRIYQALAINSKTGTPRELPLVIPRPVQGLVSQRVLVMDYLDGVPLSRAKEEMEKKGIDPDGPEAKLFRRKLLSALTTVFGRTILETGFFHADPHPGNIFVLKDGRIGLIDFGQVKQISGRSRETLCKLMVALDARREDEPADQKRLGDLFLELGLKLNADAKEEAAAAVGIWLFDGTVDILPGGYDKGELSPNSPIREIKSFPQDVVLVGRSSILIKGLSARLGIPWSLAKEWAPIARAVLNGEEEDVAAASSSSENNNSRVRFHQVWQTAKLWTKGRGSKIVRKLPGPVRRSLASFALRLEERKTRRKLTVSNK